MLTTAIQRGTLKRNFYLASIICSIAYLMFYYRHVGLHDGFVYIQAGKDIANGENPYTSGITRSGTISSLLIYFIYWFMPKAISAQIFQLINLSCIAWFMWAIKGRGFSVENYLLAVLLSIWISPVRELLAINQVNSFIIALLGTCIYLTSNSNLKNSRLKSAGIGLCFAFALDLKPHLILVVLLVWVINERSMSILFWSLSSYIALHALVDLYIGEFVESTWFERISIVQDSASTTNLGDSVTIWPIFQKIFPQWTYLVPKIALSIFAVITLLAIYYALRKKGNIALVLALAAPGFYVYFHFYDMIPIALIFIVLIIKTKKTYLTYAILSFLIIPKEFTSLRNLALILAITFILWNSTKNTKSSIKTLVIGYIMYGTICVINNYLFDTPRITQSIFVSELLLILVTYNLRMLNSLINSRITTASK